MTWVLAVLCLAAGTAAGPAGTQDPSSSQPAPVLTELRLEGVSVYKKDDVLWLLGLREGSPLTGEAQAVAKALQDRYERDGYSEARVTGSFESGRLTLSVDEGRIDEVEILGVPESDAARFLQRLGIEPGDIYNKRVVGRATARLIADSRGALSIGEPRQSQPRTTQRESIPGEVVLERRGTRHVLVVPLRWNRSRNNTSLGSGREDLYSPADGLSPAFAHSTTLFDHRNFNHTFLDGYVSYKFGRDDPGYSAGVERPRVPRSRAPVSWRRDPRHYRLRRPVAAERVRAGAGVGHVQEQLPRLLSPPRGAGVRAVARGASQRARRNGAMGSAPATAQRHLLFVLPRRRRVPASAAGRGPACQCVRDRLHVRHTPADRRRRPCYVRASPQRQLVRVTHAPDAGPSAGLDVRDRGTRTERRRRLRSAHPPYARASAAGRSDAAVRYAGYSGSRTARCRSNARSRSAGSAAFTATRSKRRAARAWR